MTSPQKNVQIILNERPQKGPVTDTTFKSKTVDVPELKDGEILARVDYASVVSYVTWPIPSISLSLTSLSLQHSGSHNARLDKRGPFLHATSGNWGSNASKWSRHCHCLQS